ncbi:MAG: 3-phosphoshikimate 1-carboxyvinyltransferase [Rhodothermales bacterium]
MNQTVRTAARLEGAVALPADKSIAHRAALLAALGDGRSTITNYPSSADPQSTLSCLRQLGVDIEDDQGILTVEGRGLDGLLAPTTPLDCGNSGTLMRLLAGILAGQSFDSILLGDASLNSRPMARIADPLRRMNAAIDLNDGHAPIRISGGQSLKGIEYRLPVPSAQVKSCVLLAGLFAHGETTVVETVPSRDHTERMLGLDMFEMGQERYLTIREGHPIPARTWAVPRDFSAAAFFLVAGSIVPEGEIYLPGVGLNPSRSALLDVLRAMGADITLAYEREEGGEPLADLTVRPAALHGVTLSGPLIPNLIDEIPVLAVAAAYAEGRSEIRDAAELRVKETDRIDAMVKNLRALGAIVEEFDDGLAIEGGPALHGATVESFEDHRIAMAMGVAGLVASGETTILGAACAAVSFPDFWEALARLQGNDETNAGRDGDS